MDFITSFTKKKNGTSHNRWAQVTIAIIATLIPKETCCKIGK